MLSLIYGLCRGFYERQDYWPNVLLINASHRKALPNDLGSIDNVHQLRALRIGGVDAQARRTSKGYLDAKQGAAS